MGIAYILLSSLISASPAQIEKPKVQILEPKKYIIRRFQEIIETTEAVKPKTNKEKLIRFRAKALIAEKKLKRGRALQAVRSDAGGHR